MNGGSNLKRYLRKRINTIIREISTPATERTTETFHRLRVEIKKIRALFSLLNYFDDNFRKREKKYFEPFEPLFKTAGKVRKLQIEDELMRDYKIDINRKKPGKHIGEFEKETSNKTKRKIEKAGEKIEKHIRDISEKHLVHYNKHAFSEIKKLVKDQLTEEETHEFRKQIKDFLYNLKLTVSSSDKIIIETDRLQEIIGKWHDREIILIHLKKILYDTKPRNNPSVARLKQAIKKISDENKKLFQEINEERKKLKELLMNMV